MKVSRLTARYHLNGCRSLKEKRKRLKGLRDRFGKITNVAVCESGFQDSLQRSEWSFIAGAQSAVVVEQTLAKIELSLENVDAQLLDIDREQLL